MIITVTIDTDNRTFYAADENDEMCIEYNACNSKEITVEEIINDFLT